MFGMDAIMEEHIFNEYLLGEFTSIISITNKSKVLSD